MNRCCVWLVVLAAGTKLIRLNGLAPDIVFAGGVCDGFEVFRVCDMRFVGCPCEEWALVRCVSSGLARNNRLCVFCRTFLLEIRGCVQLLRWAC